MAIGLQDQVLIWDLCVCHVSQEKLCGVESGGEASPFLRYRLPDVVSPYGTLKTTAVYRHTCDIDVRDTNDTDWMGACIGYTIDSRQSLGRRFKPGIRWVP